MGDTRSLDHSSSVPAGLFDPRSKCCMRGAPKFRVEGLGSRVSPKLMNSGVVHKSPNLYPQQLNP